MKEPVKEEPMVPLVDPQVGEVVGDGPVGGAPKEDDPVDEEPRPEQSEEAKSAEAVEVGKEEVGSPVAMDREAEEPVGEKKGPAKLATDAARREDGSGDSRGVPAALIVFLALGLLIAGLVAGGVFLLRARKEELPSKQADRDLVLRNQFLRDGWMAVATERLRGFMEAGTVEEKAKHVIGGGSRQEEMRVFYEGREFGDADTPLAAFIHHELDLPDRKRGIFLMRYERPEQFSIREFFRPVAPLEVQYQVEDPGLLLSSFALLENFAVDPVRVMAFFKQEGDDLLLDWDVYVQTKYRTLKEFSSFPRPGTNRTFRVLIQEDIPESRQPDPKLVRYYRIADPSNAEDYVKVPVPVASEAGRTLAPLNWVGVVVSEVPVRTATVELEWTTGVDPKLRLKEFLCWEFAGLGGEPGKPAGPPPPQAEQVRAGAGGTRAAVPVPVPDGGERPGVVSGP